MNFARVRRRLEISGSTTRNNVRKRGRAVYLKSHNPKRGFTLIELLVVVAIIGIIAALIIPNLLDALQKSKQKRTISDMRNTGNAWLSWLTDQVSAASAGQAGFYDSGTHTTLQYTEIYEHLRHSDTTFYMQEVPQLDGWGFDFSYCRNSNLEYSLVMSICSPGRNGSFGENPDGATNCCDYWTIGSFITTDYDQDLVWADGYMVRAPYGFKDGP